MSENPKYADEKPKSREDFAGEVVRLRLLLNDAWELMTMLQKVFTLDGTIKTWLENFDEHGSLKK